jgi:dihydroorotase
MTGIFICATVTAMAAVVPHTARQFARAIVMPNLRPPVTTVAAATAYRARILAALPAGMAFEPLMTLYLTDSTPVDEIRRAVASEFVRAVKLYPAGATTNSDAGVTNLDRCAAVLTEMERSGLPLLVHGEVTDSKIDVFDREKVFIERVFKPLLVRYPGLKVVFEHITTRDAADFVAACRTEQSRRRSPRTTSLYNRNAIFAGGLRPHYYCLPVLKRERPSPGAAARGDFRQPAKFFLGHRFGAACR